jgi:glycogen debranching enzyme
MTGSGSPWIDEHAPELKGRTLVTVSMEGYVPELKGDAREANTRGGLGAYFGDKLEGLGAIGMDRSYGCIPLYRKRLVQSIVSGRQHIEYRSVSYDDQPIERVKDSSGNLVGFDVWGWDVKNTAKDRQHHVEVYSIRRAGTLLYLFHCPEVFDVLYPDDKTHRSYGRKHRFLQETVFAECVYELLKRLDIVPDILHLNEGHVAGAAAKIRGDCVFDNTAVVYTNHTVVPAGMERFSVDGLTGGDVARARYAMRFPWESHQRFWKKFAVKQNNRWFIDLSRGASETCDTANGVSAEHAQATQTLFPEYDRKIEPVLNGSGDSWVADELLEMERKGTKPDKETLDGIFRKGKALSLAEVTRRTVGMTDKKGRIINAEGAVLNPDLPTIWLVRRIVQYKSQLPVLKDIVGVICADRNQEVDTLWGKMNGLGMQVVVGGITPEGAQEEKWIEEFVEWMQRPDLKGRFVFVPNSDTELLRMQAIGADICINCPLPEKEACGTSDQRSARNGGINVATRSGGPPEYIEDGRSGMLAGPYNNDKDFQARAPKDILDRLRQLSQMYYSRGEGNSAWLDMKMESYLASSTVTAAAMEQRYAGVYVRALKTRRAIVEKLIRGYHDAPHRKILSDLMFKVHDSSSDLLYYDSGLKGWTVITGSPYLDQRKGSQLYNWARDAMVALPGLCLERERLDIFAEALKSYLRFVKNGILPNLIGDGVSPRYSTIDTSLWLFWTIGKYLERTKDYSLLDTVINRRFSQNGEASVYEILTEIIETYRNGTEFEDVWKEDGNEKKRTIRMRPDSDGLISAGDENTPVTWMDVKPKGGKPVTSRHGKAVEINALWYNALRVMADIRTNRNSENTEYVMLAEKVKASFVKFWNERTGCLYDTIDGDPAQGEKVRPNQVFAVALGLLDIERSRAVMGKVRQELLTPFGLRTLSVRDPDYKAVHTGEYSYHQGTVLPWLIGTFIEGCIIAYGKDRTLRILHGTGYFAALSRILETFESIPEVFDGGCDSFEKCAIAKGCEVQAWNAGESLRSLSLLSSKDASSDEYATETGSKIIYEMVIRDYYDAEAHLSGLSVAQQELPFLAESGVEYVYLLGLMKHNGNPFDITNPVGIDDRAGSFEDLDRFVSAVHQLNMKVIVDWLANQHISKQSPICTAHPDWFLYTDAMNGDFFVHKDMRLRVGREMRADEKNLVLVSATDEVPLRSFPRRWSTLAQPDLSHPEVRDNALKTGRFWLAKGLDGFRVDAALSTFPDKIKENWGLDVNDNLTYLFIQEMRRMKPDCFIMFEGFERLEELLQLADYEDCAVYNWRPRNLTTDALNNPAALPTLTGYLKELEHTQHISNELVSLGPEHDAFDFEDPWAKLDYTERLLLHFLYAFLPGYILVFNGQVFGKNHAYKRSIEHTAPAPRVGSASSVERETGRKLFGLRNEYPQLISGDYAFLENGGHDVIKIARFDEKTIIIGLVNINSEEEQAVLSLRTIINGCLIGRDIKQVNYTQDVLSFKDEATGWVTQTGESVPAEKLLQEGLPVRIAPRSCQAVRLSLSV